MDEMRENTANEQVDDVEDGRNTRSFVKQQKQNGQSWHQIESIMKFFINVPKMRSSSLSSQIRFSQLIVT